MSPPDGLYIVGAGGLGREVLGWLHESPSESRNWELKGFLDSRVEVLNGYDIKVPILGDPMHFDFTVRERVICAIGNPKDKLQYCDVLATKGVLFLSLVHPTALVSPHALLGDGCIVATDSMIGPGAKLGAYATILGSSIVGSDSSIGEGTTISAFSSVGEGAILGNGVFLGSHAMVMPGTKVGDYARIGARTVVSGTVAPRATFFGIPARMIWAADAE